jgi:hypothetical protein
MLIPALLICGDSHYEALTIVRSPDFTTPEKVASLAARTAEVATITAVEEPPVFV